MLPRARGTWTINPYPGSATVTSLKAARIAPQQRVTAKVMGAGTTRTLVYHASKLPNTRLLFLEVLPDGTQFPILNTTTASGRHRFRVETGSGYGLRRLRVVVIQGAGATMSRVAARYRVNAPQIPRATGVVDAPATGSRCIRAGGRSEAQPGIWYRCPPAITAGWLPHSCGGSGRARPRSCSRSIRRCPAGRQSPCGR